MIIQVVCGVLLFKAILSESPTHHCNNEGIFPSNQNIRVLIRVPQSTFYTIMVLLNNIEINPPILNSSCAWSSDLRQLTDLYESRYTGAITTRTATLHGFAEDTTHTVAFSASGQTTLNSYGYSPHALSNYLDWVQAILLAHPTSTKPVIISITASDPATLGSMVDSIQILREKLSDSTTGTLSRIAIELNTSCPNIPNSAPSGYSFKALSPLLQVLANAHFNDPTLSIGLKLPPYVYKDQFSEVIAGIKLFSAPPHDPVNNPIAFLTCTNTLGNCLLFSDQAITNGDQIFAVPTALGGLAGDSLHPLALGNVFTFKSLISSQEAKDAGIAHIKIIGVGGVNSREAAMRMRNAGATVVGCATLFGKEGIQAFEIIGKE